MFKDATLYFSQSTPNLAMVIPIMDHIDKHLVTSATGDNYPLALLIMRVGSLLDCPSLFCVTLSYMYCRACSESPKSLPQQYAIVSGSYSNTHSSRWRPQCNNLWLDCTDIAQPRI